MSSQKIFSKEFLKYIKKEISKDCEHIFTVHIKTDGKDVYTHSPSIVKNDIMKDWIEVVYSTKGDKLFYYGKVLHKRTPKGMEYYQTPDGKWEKCVTLKLKGIK